MLSQGVAAQLDNVTVLREQGVVRSDAFIDVLHQQLVRDPLAALATVYERLGMTFDQALEQKLNEYLASKQGASADSHRYSNLTPERVRRDRPLFARYQALYGVPDEV